jgi:hypothetical protein
LDSVASAASGTQARKAGSALLPIRVIRDGVFGQVQPTVLPKNHTMVCHVLYIKNIFYLTVSKHGGADDKSIFLFYHCIIFAMQPYKRQFKY